MQSMRIHLEYYWARIRNELCEIVLIVNNA